MVELIHDDVIVELWRCLFREVLRVKGLNGDKQIVNAFRLIAAHKHLSEVRVLEYSSEGIQTLLKNFFPVRHKQQAAGSIRILLAKTLVVQRRDDRLAGTGGSHHQIARIATDSALCLQLVQNLLLVGIGVDVHGVDIGIVGVEIFFRLQCPCQALSLILRVVFKFAVIPVILKGSGDLVNGFGQVAPRYFCVPFKAAGQSRIGQVGRANIGRREAGFAVKDICLGVEPGRFGVVADLDLRIGQLSQFLNGFYIGSTHIGGGDDAELTVAVRKLPQLVHDEPQTAPFDEGHQHVNSVSRDNLFFELRKHLRLMHSPGEK